MGLKTAIQSAAGAGFKALGDIKTECFYVRVDPGTHNTTTGVDSDTKQKIKLVSDVVLVRYKKSEVDDEDVLKTDQKCLVIQSDLHFRPNKSDRLEMGREIYRIIDIGQDPAGAMWIMQIRKGI